MKIRSIGHTKLQARIKKTDRSRELESAQSPMFSGRMMYQKAYVPPKPLHYYRVENRMAGGTEYAYAGSEAQARLLVAQKKNMPLRSLRAVKADDDLLARLVAIR